MDTVKRVRAARGAVNMSLDDFAEAIGIGRQTLIRIENGTREVKDYEYEAMARISGLPVGFFYANLEDALVGEETHGLSERVDQLAQAVVELASGNAADALRKATIAAGQATAETPSSAEAQRRRR